MTADPKVELAVTTGAAAAAAPATVGSVPTPDVSAAPPGGERPSPVGWWLELPTWQQVLFSGTAAAVCLATGGAVAYAIALGGGTVVVAGGGGMTTTIAIGKGAMELAKKIKV